MNLELFYIVNTNCRLLDIIKEDTYYGKFYKFFNNEISLDEYLETLKQHFTTNEGIGKKMALKIIKSVIKLKNIEVDNYLKIDTDVYYLNNNLEELVTNKNLIVIFDSLINDLDSLCHYYYLYQKNIFENFDISSNPIEIIIEDKNKIYIHEGTHRFIISHIKNVTPIFNIKHSNYETYDKIFKTLQNDYNEMYKKSSSNFIIYNKIPHTIFHNHKTIREDRSPHIIEYLSKKIVNNGLEIGPQNGLLSIELSKSSYNMKCIEYDKKYYELTNNIIELCEVDKKVEVIFGNIYDIYDSILEFEYDFIVSLSVFYHLKRNDNKKFDRLIKNLIKKTKFLIFDDEPNTGIFNIEDIKKIVDSLDYVYLEVLHKGNDNRTIYVISHK